MTTPLAPGVIVNVSQTPLAVSPETSGAGLAAFCLPYNIGPTTPVQVSSFEQFANLFGTFAQSNGSFLHHSVYQYFNNGGSSCLVCRVPNTDAVAATLALADLGLQAPATPSPTFATTGGTVAAGVYKVEQTYVTASGETLPSSFATVTTTGSTATISIPSPAAAAGATGWYAYVTQVGGSTYTRQQTAGSPTNIGTALTITAPPTSSGLAPPVTSAATTNVITVKANSVGAWGNGVQVALTSANGLASGGTPASGPRFNLLVYANGNTSSPAETFPSVSVNPNDSRSLAAVVNSPFAGSKFITVTVTMPTGGYVQGVTDPAFVSATSLASGADGSTIPSSTSTPTLSASVAAAFNMLQNQIVYLNLPGLTVAGSPQTPDVTTINALLAWADSRGNTMLVIDGPNPNPPLTSAQVAANYIALVSGTAVLSSDANGGVYAPYMYVLDPSSSVQGSMRYVPPGGAMLAVWDRAQQLYGIQQAPAGTWATVNTQSLETLFTQADQAALNAAQINPIIAIPNVGFAVFGARTLNVGMPDRYINVQRTIIQVTSDLNAIILPFTFQNNDATLWANVTAALTTYLTQQMQAGVLAGSTPAQAFNVLCDATNNTPTTATSGFVYATVGIAVSSPAEFFVISLQLLSGSSTTSTS